MLKKRDYVPYAPDAPGVTRINHEAPWCQGDSKSMRIERKDDGSIHAKCFRCGSWGVDGGSAGTVAQLKQALSKPVEADTKAEGRDGNLGRIIDTPSSWPVLAYHWVRKHGILAEEFKEYALRYSEGRRRVLLPIWWGGEQVGYQLRKIYDDDAGPKYDTRMKGGFGFMSLPAVTNNGVVVVEDILSAIKVGRQVRAVALLSTGMSPAVKAALSHYDKFWVWLDMDNPQVIRQAVKLLKTLRNFGDAELVVTPNDPKYYSDDEIRRYLYDS